MIDLRTSCQAVQSKLRGAAAICPICKIEQGNTTSASKAANMDVLKLAREFDLPALEDQACIASAVL